MNKRDQAEYHALLAQQQGLIDALTVVRRRMQELAPFGNPDQYRIALRPDVHGEDPMKVDTLLDDIVVTGVPMFRAEQMYESNWWVACYLDDDTHDRICWSVTAKTRPLRIEWRTTEWPDVATYEHEATGG